MEMIPQNILYSTDLADLVSFDWKGWCVHMACTEGTLGLMFDGRLMEMRKGDLFVSSRPELITLASPGPEGCKIEMIIAPNNFLQSLLPQNNYSVAGSISLYANPILKLTENETQIILQDFRRIGDRLAETEHPYFHELIGSLCLTMIYDIFAFHRRLNVADEGRVQPTSIVSRLTGLLETGLTRRHRDVAYYAEKLNVSPKYLTTVVRRLTGQSATTLINRYAIPILAEYLNNTNLTLTQICEEMDFGSVSYLSRYVKKHLGLTPTKYRSSLS